LLTLYIDLLKICGCKHSVVIIVALSLILFLRILLLQCASVSEISWVIFVDILHVVVYDVIFVILWIISCVSVNLMAYLLMIFYR